MTKRQWMDRERVVRRLEQEGISWHDAGVLVDKLHRIDAAATRAAEGLCSGLTYNRILWRDYAAFDSANQAYVAACERDYYAAVARAWKVLEQYPNLGLESHGDPRGAVLRIVPPSGDTLPVCW